MINKTNNTSKKQHILVISQYFYPENFRINDICLEWIQRGYDVTVVTGIPNYPEGKIYPGYGFTKRRKEKWHGINIIRIPLIPRGNTKVGLILNYLSFMITGYFAGKILEIDTDYIFSFETSPMTQVITGISFAKKLKVPHYLYVQDLWPESVQAVTGINSSIIINPLNKMVDYIYRNSDEIFATSNSYVEAIINRETKVDRKKVHYWPQYAEDFYKPINSMNHPLIPNNNNFKIIFTGNIGEAQGLDILTKAAKILKNKDIDFIIVGDGRYKSKLIETIKEYEVEEKFILISRQKPEEIPSMLSACDVAFLSFNYNDLWKMCIPAKLQSYMACGMPILASAEGETKKIIDESQCGIATPLGDEKKLSKAIVNMMNKDLTKFGERSYKYFLDNFEKKLLMDKIELFFNEL